MSIGNLQKILLDLHDIHNLLCDLILKHESTSPEFIWGFQCSLLGSKIHYLGQEKPNSLHGSTQVVNIHYLGQIHNLGQNMLFRVGHLCSGQKLSTELQIQNVARLKNWTSPFTTTSKLRATLLMPNGEQKTMTPSPIGTCRCIYTGPC